MNRSTFSYRKSPAWILLLIVSGLLVGIAHLATAQTAPQAPYNIILLTPDQLSADYMHTYGYPYPDTPNIDQLAHEGTAFTRAYAAGSYTTPSFGTILTGLFPTVHGMTLPPYQGCGPSITDPITKGTPPTVPSFLLLSPYKPIIPDLLKKDGMVTAIDNANCWSFWDVATRSWDAFHIALSSPGQRNLSAPDTTAWAQQWLKAHSDQRFFFWIHYIEPHSPYNAPADYDRFKTPDDFPDLADGPDLHNPARLQNTHAIRRLRELYSAKILYVDDYVGQIIKTVRGLGLDKNTIVILVSDHGELLYSHPEDFNSNDHRSLYDADLHVPLIFWGPGIPAGKRSDVLVSHYDILPTILDLENLPPPSQTSGVSLKGIVQGTSSAPPHDYLYSEESILKPQYSVRDARYKLIETMPTGEIQCFDNVADIRELHNICEQIPQEAARLKAALDQHIQTLIGQAKSYPDWENNIGLAVLEQRDSQSLNTLAPQQLTVSPGSENDCQMNGSGWSIVKGPNDLGDLAYWAAPGPASARVIWRSDTPLIGDYEISVSYGGTGQAAIKQASDADYTVRFKGGSLSFPLDQNQQQRQWHSLGRFHDPAFVQLTNRANGAVVAGSVRFVRIE